MVALGVLAEMLVIGVPVILELGVELGVAFVLALVVLVGFLQLVVGEHGLVGRKSPLRRKAVEMLLALGDVELLVVEIVATAARYRLVCRLAVAKNEGLRVVAELEMIADASAFHEA